MSKFREGDVMHAPKKYSPRPKFPPPAPQPSSRPLPPPPPLMRKIGGSDSGFMSPVLSVIFGIAFMLAMTGPLWIKWL